MARTYSRQRVRVVKKGGFFGKFVSFFLGLILGIAILGGALFGAGYYAYKNPLNKTVNTIDKYANTNLYATLFGTTDDLGNQVGGYLNKKYAEMTIREMIPDVTAAVDALSGEGTLADINEITPKADEIVDKLLDKAASYSIPLDKETLMTTKINELPDYILTQAKSMPLGDLLELAKMEKDALYYALCYGEEGVDYVMNGDEVEPISTPRSLDDLLTKGLNGVVESMTLQAAAGKNLDLTDNLMCTLAFGSANRYEIVDGKPIMKQIAYVLDDKGEGAKLYGDDGKAVEGTFANDTLTLEDGTVQYLVEVTTSDNTFAQEAIAAGKVVYHAYTDENRTEAALYKKTSVGALLKNPMGMVEGVTLDTFIPVNKDTHAVLLAMMYGSDGYYLDENKTPVPTASCKTIGDLRANSTDLINGVYLKDVLPVTASSPAVMLYLAYGEKGVDYTIDSQGKIDCDNPRTFGDLSQNSDAIINDMPLKEALGVNSKSHPVVIALAYGTKGTDYTIEDKGVDEEGDGDNLSIVPAATAPTRTLSQLLGSGSATLLNQLQLSDALGLDNSSHKILLALAFGSDGYEFDSNGDAIAKDGATPTTLGALSGSGSQTLIENLYLADALGLNKDSHKILLALAFGADGYEFDREDNAIPKDGVTPTKLSQLMGSGATTLIEGIYLSDALGLNRNSHSVLLSLAFGVGGYEFDNEGNAIPKDGVTPRTLSALMGGGSGTLINEIPLTDVIPANPNDELTMHLLYGRKDIHYAVNGNEITSLQKRILLHNGVWYNEYGEPLTGSVSENTYTAADGAVYTIDDAGITQEIHLKETKVVDDTTDPVTTKEVINTYEAQVYYLSQNGKAVYYTPTTIGDMGAGSDVLSSMTSRITISELLGKETVENHFLLQHVANETINTMSVAVDNLSFQQVYKQDIYVNGVDDSQGMHGMWQYLLHDDETGKEVELTFADLDQLADNMAANIQKATLKDLVAHKIVNVSENTMNLAIERDESGDAVLLGTRMIKSYTLETNPLTGKEMAVPSAYYELPDDIKAMTGKPTVGEFTVEEMMAYVDAMMTTIDFYQKNLS